MYSKALRAGFANLANEMNEVKVKELKIKLNQISIRQKVLLKTVINLNFVNSASAIPHHSLVFPYECAPL